MRKLFLSHTVQHVYTDQEIKDMVKKSIGLDKSKVTEYRWVGKKALEPYFSCFLSFVHSTENAQSSVLYFLFLLF